MAARGRRRRREPSSTVAGCRGPRCDGGLREAAAARALQHGGWLLRASRRWHALGRRVAFARGWWFRLPHSCGGGRAPRGWLPGLGFASPPLRGYLALPTGAGTPCRFEGAILFSSLWLRGRRARWLHPPFLPYRSRLWFSFSWRVLVQHGRWKRHLSAFWLAYILRAPFGGVFLWMEVNSASTFRGLFWRLYFLVFGLGCGGIGTGY